jgi:hypothetical protein
MRRARMRRFLVIAANLQKAENENGRERADGRGRRSFLRERSLCVRQSSLGRRTWNAGAYLKLLEQSQWWEEITRSCLCSVDQWREEYGDEACFWIRRIYSLFGSVRCHFAFQPRAAPGCCVPYLWPLLCVLISSSQVHSAEAGCRSLRRPLVGRFLCRCTPAANRVWRVCCQFGWREFDASLRGNIISSSSHSL